MVDDDDDDDDADDDKPLLLTPPTPSNLWPHNPNAASVVHADEMLVDCVDGPWRLLRLL